MHIQRLQIVQNITEYVQDAHWSCTLRRCTLHTWSGGTSSPVSVWDNTIQSAAPPNWTLNILQHFSFPWWDLEARTHWICSSCHLLPPSSQIPDKLHLGLKWLNPIGSQKCPVLTRDLFQISSLDNAMYGRIQFGGNLGDASAISCSATQNCLLF